jgi:hypothetical protein
VREFWMVIFSPQSVEVEQKSQWIERILQCVPGHIHDRSS